MSFLVAEWRKLAIFNYEVNPTILEKYVPHGMELDLWNEKCYVSLIGFMFLNTKLLGIKVPFHTDFEEVNLRFYVKRKEEGEWKRGVVFIKEIVPKPALTFVANTVYNENYETMEMRHNWQEDAENRKVAYQWRKKNGWNSIAVVAEKEGKDLLEGSETEFITEHYWGYAKINETSTNEYEVTHPRWKTYDVLNYKLDVDFEEIYGEEFSFLNQQEPSSVMLAEGSEITVENKIKIT
ncbi:YqjF family protein [Aureivirga marina]|uniref:YqjF family protein n=1 Tax=Aureivirga marina TaxID=1182451 RepID=UPI0018C8F2E0|nr:DUF2071 domain-containing protein [Aureivirga marina]